MEFARGGYATLTGEEVKTPLNMFGTVQEKYMVRIAQAQKDIKGKKYFTIDTFLASLPLLIAIGVLLLLLLMRGAAKPQKKTAEGKSE
jgi:hypothetical protein